MGLRVGDTLFRDGVPGVIASKDEATGALTVDTEGGRAEQIAKIGYVNGLLGEQRENFQRIMGEVKQLPEMGKRVELLNAKIEELEKDPRQFTLTKYLRAELAHSMYTNGIFPRKFTIDEKLV